jgi:hypothetical protein
MRSKRTDVSDSKLRRMWRRRRAVVCASGAGIATAALSVTLTAVPSTAGVTAGSPIPASALPQLSVAAARLARFGGDARPASIMAVITTRAIGLQEATPGDTVPGSANQLVYLVVMVGRFTLDGSVPRGAHLPTGRYLAVTVDPTTFQIMDLGLCEHAPPVALGRYGPVSNLTNRR